MHDINIGAHVLLFYPMDTVHHERILLGWFKDHEIYVVTPDGDLYPGTVSVSSLSYIHLLPADRSMPWGSCERTSTCLRVDQWGLSPPPCSCLPYWLRLKRIEMHNVPARACRLWGCCLLEDPSWARIQRW